MTTIDEPGSYAILIVEDDSAVKSLIATALKVQGYRGLEASTGAAALLEATTKNPDVIILDLGLPDADGITLIREIRTWSRTPIIVVSTRTDDADKVAALDAGADDYLTKPFSVEELLARLRVATRRLAVESATDAEGPLYEKRHLAHRFCCTHGYPRKRRGTPYPYRVQTAHPPCPQYWQSTNTQCHP